MNELLWDLLNLAAAGAQLGALGFLIWLALRDPHPERILRWVVGGAIVLPVGTLIVAVVLAVLGVTPWAAQ